MRKLFGLLLLGIGLAAVPVAAANAPPKPEPSYTFTFTQAEMLYIANLLRERPYKEVASLLQKMQDAINAQIEARKKEPKK